MVMRYKRFGNGTRTRLAKSITQNMKLKRKQKAMRFDY